MSYDYIWPSGLIVFIKWTTENYTGLSEIISFDNSTATQTQNNDLKPVFQKPLHTDDTDTQQWFETRVSETTTQTTQTQNNDLKPVFQKPLHTDDV